MLQILPFVKAARRPIQARNNRRARFELERLEERSLLSYMLSVLASFSGSNGEVPTSGLLEDSGGNLFGTTSSGGANGDGTIFEWVKSTGAISILANFGGANGDRPSGTLVEDSSGNLFGMTSGGGTYSNGTVFKWVKSTGTISVLANSLTGKPLV